MFVRSPDGALHRVVRHATPRRPLPSESIPSDYHLDCQCMLDNGEALTWIGDNRYRQVDGGKVYTAVRPQQAQGDARKQNPDAEPALDACRTQAGPSPPPRTELPLAVINLKTGNDWSLIRAWREHLVSAPLTWLPGWGGPLHLYRTGTAAAAHSDHPGAGIGSAGVSPEQLDDSSFGGHMH